MATGIYEHTVTIHTDTLLNREPCRLRREKDELICLECPLRECIFEYDDERGRRKRITPNSESTIIFLMILGPEKKRVNRTKMGRPKKVVETQKIAKQPKIRGTINDPDKYGLPDDKDDPGLPFHSISSNGGRGYKDSGLSSMVGFPSCGRDSNETFWAGIMARK